MAVQSFVAGGAISSGRCVKLNASGQAIQATVAGEQCIGIALASASASGDLIAVACEGEFVSIASIDGVLTCATDLLLQTAADGQLAALAPVAGSGKFSIGYPVFNTTDTATVANDVLGVIVSVAQVTDPSAATNITALQADVTRLEGRDLYMTLAAGAEAGNAITVTVSKFDSNGVADAAARSYCASLYNDNGIEVLAAAGTITMGANAVADSTDAQARVFFSNLGTATFALVVTDVTTALAGDLWLVVELMSQDGSKCQPARIALTFA